MTIEFIEYDDESDDERQGQELETSIDLCALSLMLLEVFKNDHYPGNLKSETCHIAWV